MTTPHPHDRQACDRCQTAYERGDLLCSVCGYVRPLDAMPVEHVTVSVMRCDGCGAAVRYDIDHQAPACAFCGSVMQLQELVDPPEQTDTFFDFRVTPDEARAALRQWISQLGFWYPNDLLDGSQVEEIRPLYWVAWVCDAEVVASWTADTNVGANRARWAAHAGQHRLDYKNRLITASRGLTWQETDALAAHYSTHHSGPEPVGEPPNTVTELFDMQRSAARDRVLNAIATEVQHDIIDRLPGSRYRNLHLATRLSGLVTRRYALPAYVLAYRYRNELYRVVVHGQDATRVIGNAPKSWIKQLIATLLVFMLVIAGLALFIFLLQP